MQSITVHWSANQLLVHESHKNAVLEDETLHNIISTIQHQTVNSIINSRSAALQIRIKLNITES